MQKLIRISVIALLVAAGLSHAGRSGELRIKVLFKDRHEARALEKLGLKGDFRTGGRASGLASLYAVPEELEKVKALGLPYTVDPSRTHAQPSATPAQVIAEMDRLVKAYPQICSKRVYGKSVNGVELSALKISDNAAADENEPECLFDGGIHGDEFVGTDLMLRFAGWMASKYAGDAAVRGLVDSREIWFFFMVNPDGRGKSRNNANDIDLNRDWGYMAAKGFTQPETRAVRDCLLENRFSVHISYHAGSEYLLYPWCHASDPSADRGAHAFLADLYSTTSKYYSKDKNIQSNLDYPTSGETVDYSYGTQGSAALTMELTEEKGTGISEPHYAANHPAMLKIIEHAGYGLAGTVTDAVTGKGVAAAVYVGNSFPSYSDPRLGDFHKFVPPGKYTLTVVADGYQPQTLAGVEVQSGEAVPTDFRLQPDPAGRAVFGYKVVYAEPGKGRTPDALGKPDGKGYAGSLIVDMRLPVQDSPGMDLTLHAIGNGKEYSCSAAEALEGPWKSLGKASATSGFDLGFAGLKGARYFRIEGANLDAVEAKTEIPVALVRGTKRVAEARMASGTRAGGRLLRFNAAGRTLSPGGTRAR